MHGHRAVLSPRRKARQPQKAGKRGAGVARAFTSAQPQLAGPFAEKEGQGSDATAAFLRQMHLPKAKKTSEQSGLCSDAARVFPVRLARPAPTFPAPRGAAPQKAGKRGAGVARAFTSAQPQLAGPFAEKEEQGSGATAAFLRQMHLPKAKKTPEQSGLCSDAARVFPVRHAHPAPSPAPQGAAAAKGRKARRRRRARVYKRAAAASGAFCGKGGARERGDGGFFAADAICQKQKRRRSKADFAPTWWRRHPESNRGMRILQTLALPLGYVAEDGAGDGARTRHLSLGKAALYQMSYSRRSAARAAG